MINKKEMDRRILSMILPVALEGTLQMIGGIVVMGMIGRLDVAAVSAMSISFRITQIIWALFRGIATGVAVFVAQYHGARSHEKLVHTVQQTLVSAVLFSVVLCGLCWIFAKPLLMLFGPDPRLLADSIAYMKISLIGLPLLTIMLVTGGALQAMGNVRTPMHVTFIMNAINIIVGWLLIFGNLGLPAMGLNGGAWATVIAQAGAAVLGIYILFHPGGLLSGYALSSLWKLDLASLKKIYKVAIPSSMEYVFWQFAALILVKVMLTFGEVALAAYQLGLQAESISFMPSMGFGIAAAAFVGQSLGAGKPEEARLYLRQIIKLAAAVSGVASLALVLWPKLLMTLLTNNNEVIALGAIYLILMGVVQVPQNIGNVLSGAMRGAGYTKLPMIIASVGLWGIRVPISLVAVYLLRLNVYYVWGAISIDMLARVILGWYFYKKKDIYHSALVENQGNKGVLEN